MFACGCILSDFQQILFADMVEKATWVTKTIVDQNQVNDTVVWDRICTCSGFIPHGPGHKNSGHKVKQSFTINKKSRMGQKVILRYL